MSAVMSRQYCPPLPPGRIEIERPHGIPDVPPVTLKQFSVDVVRPEAPRVTLFLPPEGPQPLWPRETARVIALLEESLAKYGSADGRCALERALRELRS